VIAAYNRYRRTVPFDKFRFPQLFAQVARIYQNNRDLVGRQKSRQSEPVIKRLLELAAARCREGTRKYFANMEVAPTKGVCAFARN
jgi:hypothetical protein